LRPAIAAGLLLGLPGTANTNTTAFGPGPPLARVVARARLAAAIATGLRLHFTRGATSLVPALAPVRPDAEVRAGPILRATQAARLGFTRPWRTVARHLAVPPLVPLTGFGTGPSLGGALTLAPFILGVPGGTGTFIDTLAKGPPLATFTAGARVEPAIATENGFLPAGKTIPFPATVTPRCIRPLPALGTDL
jgi:hypothetical protein